MAPIRSATQLPLCNAALDEDHSELLASVAAGCVRGAHALGESPGDALQRAVAEQVADDVVESFEMVDFDHQQAERPAVAAHRGQLLARAQRTVSVAR